MELKGSSMVMASVRVMFGPMELKGSSMVMASVMEKQQTHVNNMQNYLPKKYKMNGSSMLAKPELSMLLLVMEL